MYCRTAVYFCFCVQQEMVNFWIYNNGLENGEMVPELQFTYSSCFELS